MSYKSYPVTKTNLNYEGYEVKINGQRVDLDTARVSKEPFNRRWPGHQRSIDQSELINFLCLEADEPIEFEITPKESFEKVEIRPKSLGIKPIVQNGTIKFTLESPKYFTVEPYGRHNALHIFVDPVKEYDIDKSDENVIYFGEGEHDAGIIELKSNQTLFIDKGAVVYASVRATDSENIKIVGRGILDNSKNTETILYEENAENNDEAVNNAERLHTVQIEYSDNIYIEGITIRDSLVYNIRPMACENIKIENVKIIGCWRYNSDGIDMHNCIGVDISNCFIRTYDDSICVKGFDCYYEGDVEKAVHDAMYRNGKAYDVFKNVRVSNVVIWNDWGRCLEIGAETRAEEISDIVFENSDAIHVMHSVLDCQNVDYAFVHDITYKNIRVEYDDIIPEPILQRSDRHEYAICDKDYAPNIIEVGVSYHHEYSSPGRRGKCKDIKFEDIRLYGRQKPKFEFSGHSSENSVSSVTVKNFLWNDKLLKADDCEIKIGKFAENINIEF